MKTTVVDSKTEWVTGCLKAELAKRLQKNPRYSLRRFAQTLGVSHAYLSMLMSGKKSASPAFQTRVLSRLGLPIKDWIPAEPASVTFPYALVGPDFLGRELKWYADAILELTRLPGFVVNARSVSKRIGISHTEAFQALESLKSQGLLPSEKTTAVHSTTNEVDNQTSSEVLRRYQKDLLEISLERLDSLPREKRDHSSMIMSVQESDLPELKKLIRDFRMSLSAFAQRKSAQPDRVFGLQVGLFPLDQAPTTLKKTIVRKKKKNETEKKQ